MKKGNYYSNLETKGKIIYNKNNEEVANVDYSGNTVYCDVIKINKDDSLYLQDCYVDGNKIDYEYGCRRYRKVSRGFYVSVNKEWSKKLEITICDVKFGKLKFEIAINVNILMKKSCWK